MVSFDPDIITGYNICNFDTDYLQKRAEALQIGNGFSLLTRMKEQKMTIREVVFQSAQVGKRKSNKVTIKGRAVLDVYKWMKDNFSLEEYSLNAVSAKFLGDTKEDIHFTEITPKWHQGPETRKELGIYCLKDALLPLHLMEKLNITLNAIERARVTGLPCEWVLNRGMLVRFTSQLMRESGEKGYFLPFIDTESPLRRESTKYIGATVLDVERGLWTNVAVLDFSSMYPCQIIAENLCYSTYLGQGTWPTYHLMAKPLYFQGHKFVSEKDTKGVIPCILERMLKQRKIAKAAFAEEKSDPVKKLVLKARELSYKVVCNGIYGALGCRNALIPLRAIAETTTGLGRKDIQRVKEIAETMFTKGNGYAGDAKVVCGDTDSVFVCMPVGEELRGMEAIAESMKFATLLADTVNSEMKAPKKIEPEKVFANILLMKKKRYAGLKYETLVDEPKIDIKGIECVRRDGCPLVRNIVRETVECLARTADVEAAAQLVRQLVNKVMTDAIPDEEYAVKKMLRKTIQDCSHPMTPQELITIRQAMQQSHWSNSQLTEAEQDEAIRHGIKLPWRIFRKLPHIMVAWKLRLKDPGNAPVLGESVRYVISLNGGKKVSEKAEPLEFIMKGKTMVDRHFYLASLRKAIDGIFTPIIEQRNPSLIDDEDDSKKSKEYKKKKEKLETNDFNTKVKKKVEILLWKQLLEGKLSRNSEKQKAIIKQSPIMQAFSKAAAASSAKKAKND
jgi:DNA polymerase delta subunit 1